MCWDDEQQKPDARESDWIDRIIRDAVWPDIEPARAERLRRKWGEINTLRKNRRRTRQRWLLSAAAMVLIAVSLALVYRVTSQPSDRRSLPPQPGRDLQLVDDTPHRDNNTSDKDAVRGDHSMISVSTTPGPEKKVDFAAAGLLFYEQVLIAAAQRRFNQHRAKDGPAENRNNPLEGLILQLTHEADADAAELSQSLLGEREKYERQLGSMVQQSEGPRRVAAVRLLAHVATWRSLPLLSELRPWPPTRREVAMAVARLANPVALFRLSKSEPNPELRQKFMAALLEQGSAEAVGLFLHLVRDPTVSSAALESVSHVPNRPVDVLFGFLHSPRVQVRLAAARVLGQLNNPNVSQQLVRLVFSSDVGREALVALAASDEPLATEFVRRAQLDLSLASSMRAARYRVQSFPFKRGVHVHEAVN